MLSVEDLYRRFYSEYDISEDLFDKEAKRLVKKDSIVLHGGCGADDSIGFQTKAKMTIGIDLDKGILDNSDIDYGVMGDLGRLPLVDGSMDLVVARWVLEHVSDPESFFEETSRVLKPGGHLVLLTTNLWHYFTTAVRITPIRFQRWFIHKALDRDPDEVFPTFYRANTSGRLRSLATQAGLVEEKLEMLEDEPLILKFSTPTYLVGIAYERMVNRFEHLAGMRAVILAIFEKSE